MADDILKDARERFQYSESGSDEMRRAALEDIEFGRMGRQWPAQVQRVREEEGRPCLTINRMPSFIRQVVNDARQNKPSIAVHPVDGGADADTARIIGGLIRSIERGSNAALAYDTAVDQAVSGGFGFFRITTDYVHPESFDQELRIERVANPFSVHWDTTSTAFDASDWEYAFVSEMLTKREFKRRYPKASMVNFEQGMGEDLDDWHDEERIRVAEYWLRTEEKRKIFRLTDGQVLTQDQLDQDVFLGPGGAPLSLQQVLASQGIDVAAEREATFFKVRRRMINGAEVLSEDDWPGQHIPICPVWGEEVIYRGQRFFRSLIRDARDPQRMLNFWRSASTELVALAPRAPWVVAAGTIPSGAEGTKWQTANTRSHAYLEYDATQGPAPMRTAFAGVPAGALQEALNASDDIKAVTGIFDAALGARGNETSGRAIHARQRESDKGTFHFVDNMARAIQYAGRCLIECIPSIYSERQTIRILGDDEAERVVRVARANGVAPTPEEPDGKIYDLSTGKYDVTVKVGPNYATQREETSLALMELIRVSPQAAEVLGDLMVKNMDWPGADEAARRIQLLQFMRAMQMGLPYEALARVFPEVAQMMPPPQAQPMGAPPGAMPMNPNAPQVPPGGGVSMSGGM
jgi:hypothetical protein